MHAVPAEHSNKEDSCSDVSSAAGGGDNVGGSGSDEGLLEAEEDFALRLEDLRIHPETLVLGWHRRCNERVCLFPNMLALIS